MKLLKKLAILTCALAAFSFVACDSGNSDDDEPNTPVVDGGDSAGGEEAGGATMKKFVVGITADYWKLGKSVPQVHYYGESSGRIKDSQWADKNMELNSENGIWIWESEELESDGSETISVIIHSGDTKYLNDSLITIGKPMLYTHSETFVAWDGSSGDSTDAVHKPVFEMPDLPAELKEADTVIAIDLSQNSKGNGKNDWDPSGENGMMLYAWGGNYGSSNPFEPWGGKEMKNVEGTEVWYYIFGSDVGLPSEDVTLCFHDGTGNTADDENKDRVTVPAGDIVSGQKKILLNGVLENWSSEE